MDDRKIQIEMKGLARKGAFVTALLMLLLSGLNSEAAVRGKVLLIDAPDRGKPGNVMLCTMDGKERNFETLVEGKVVDARFSPDGKQMVYGLNKTIRVMDLKTRAARDLCSFEADFTYFNWGLNNKIYWSDGPEMRQIFCMDIPTKKKTLIHKGNNGRTTLSVDGKVASWVIPPVCSFVGGKTFRYMGGCGGSVSPSGKFLTSNLTTSHKLMGIFSLDQNGPSKKPIATVSALLNHSINGFSFSRSDDWVCYMVEGPKTISPLSYICYWRTDEHIEIGKYVIKDFFDETDVLPADAKLVKISICSPGPGDAPLAHAVTNVGATRTLKVVGHYSTRDGPVTPRIQEGVTWKVDASKLDMKGSTYKGLATTEYVPVTAEYQGKRASFKVTVLPELTGDGFKAELFSDAEYTKSVLTRTDRYIDYRWTGHASPDKAINGRGPWSVRWTGMLNVQVGGEYTFYFLQGEGNDGSYDVSVDGKVVISRKLKGSNINGRWSKPKSSDPITLSKGMHSIKVRTADNRRAHPVVAQLSWSGPNIKQSLLGGGYVHTQEVLANKR